MKQLDPYWRYHTKAERRQIRVLIGIIILLIPCIYLPDYIHSSPPTDFSQFEADIAEHEAWIEELRKASIIELNTATPERLQKIKGIGPAFGKRIVKYRNMLGGYNSKTQLMDVYGFTDSLYALVEPFVRVDSSVIIHKKEKKTYKPKPVNANPVIIELNTARPEDLKHIRGIGPAFSSRIVKYRNLLGGYLYKKQLMEVYGFTDSLYAVTAPYVRIDKALIRRININKAEIRTLAGHPYISYNVAMVIVNYRDRHGPYKFVKEIMKTDLINMELFTKIEPYLTM